MQCCFKDLQVFDISKTPSLKWGREKAVLTLAPSVLTMKVRVQWPLSNCTWLRLWLCTAVTSDIIPPPTNAHPPAFSFHIQLLLLNILRHHYCKLNAKIAKSFMSIFKHPPFVKTWFILTKMLHFQARPSHFWEIWEIWKGSGTVKIRGEERTKHWSVSEIHQCQDRG